MAAIERTQTFRHEALLYEGPEDFVRRTVPFIREGLERDEPVMVAARSQRLGPLREALGPDAGGVRFADMLEIGRNPACIIPAWRAFVDAEAGRRLRGIGEPIWSERSESELVECQGHERLLNLAFADVADFHLVCPYDTETLSPEVVHAARCSHPMVDEQGSATASRHFEGPDVGRALDTPMPLPPSRARTVWFDAGSMSEVREVVARCAEHAGLSSDRVQDAVVSVHELVTNSVRHGGGMGVLRLWDDDEGLVAEVRDRGRIEDPLVGRRAPSVEQLGGWGLWIANQLCDLVQIRTGPAGTVVRLLKRRA